jgi:hypothetical protein
MKCFAEMQNYGISLKRACQLEKSQLSKLELYREVFNLGDAFPFEVWLLYSSGRKPEKHNNSAYMYSGLFLSKVYHLQSD